MGTSQSHGSEESNDSTRSARWDRECRLVTNPADHAQHVKAGDATSGPREEHGGQHADGRTGRRNHRLEKKSSNKQRRVT